MPKKSTAQKEASRKIRAKKKTPEKDTPEPDVIPAGVQPKDNSRIQIILNVLAVVFSLIAVAVSVWSNRLSIEANTLAQEANEFASQEYASNVVLLSVEPTSNNMLPLFGTEPQKFAECTQIINLANSGGVANSIVDYETEVYFRGRERDISYYIEPQILVNWGLPFSTRIDDIDFALMSTQNYHDSLGTRNSLPESYETFREYFLQLPLRIGPKDTVSIVAFSWFTIYNPSKGGWVFGETLVSDRPDQSVETFPVQVKYTLRFASGTPVTTPRFDCFYTNGDFLN